jgi:hypothetical protein
MRQFRFWTLQFQSEYQAVLKTKKIHWQGAFMANAAERLFDLVLGNLKDFDDLNWPDDQTRDALDVDPIDEPMDSSDDGIFTFDEEQIPENVMERMAGRRVFGELDSDEAEAIEGGVRSRGFEVLAFYKSRRIVSHRPFPGRWGIFYLKQGLDYVGSQIIQSYPGYGDPKNLAVNFLRAHERFHYRADLQTLMFEATVGKHLYLPLRNALRGRRSHFVEEALANRQVWDWAKRGAIGLEEFAIDFMSLQPNAYSRFLEPRLDLAAEWAGTVVDLKPPGTSFRQDLAHWVEATPSGLLRASLCPEYVIYPRKLSTWISPALVLPPVHVVQDGDDVVKLLQGRLAHLQAKWKQTKTKMLENRLLHGLNFKPWPKDGPERYSVRVDDNFRAHLQHLGGGKWLAYMLGPHKKLGHG